MLIIRVYNHLGVVQKIIEISNSDAGINKLEINAIDLPAGIYFYSLIINEKITNKKNGNYEIKF